MAVGFCAVLSHSAIMANGSLEVGGAYVCAYAPGALMVGQESVEARSQAPNPEGSGWTWLGVASVWQPPDLWQPLLHGHMALLPRHQ